jgi:hypothetical protein
VARTQRVTFGNSVTWTVVDEAHDFVEVIEQYLEFLRNDGYSPNTVKAEQGVIPGRRLEPLFGHTRSGRQRSQGRSGREYRGQDLRDTA